MPSILLIPGYTNAGPNHWMSLWEKENPDYSRVQQRDWDHPICSEWVETLQQAISKLNGEIVLVAHSLGCATVAHWANQYKHPIKAAFLVAPADVEHPEYKHVWQCFQPMPLSRLKFRSVVVASSNDPYVRLEQAEYFARCWGSEFVNIGACGHLATDDGFGKWEEGKALLSRLIES